MAGGISGFDHSLLTIKGILRFAQNDFESIKCECAPGIGAAALPLLRETIADSPTMNAEQA